MSDDQNSESQQSTGGPEASRFQRRLNEMSAAIEALGRKAGELQDDARKRLRATVDDMRAEQQRLQDWLRDAQGQGTRAWEQSRAEIERSWTDAEQRISQTAREFGAEREAAMARAGALMRTWQETASAYAERTAKAFREGRGDMDRIFDDLRARQREVQAELNDLGRSSAGAWSRVSKGFEGAWRELDKAFRAAVGEFERGKGGGSSAGGKGAASKSTSSKAGTAKSDTAKKAGTGGKTTAKSATARSSSAKSSGAKKTAAKSGAAKTASKGGAKSTAAKTSAKTATAKRSTAAKSGSAKSGAAKSTTAKASKAKSSSSKARSGAGKSAARKPTGAK